MDWQELQSTDDFDRIISRSFSIPCLIFKHSTRCEISSIAKYRIEDDWTFEEDSIEAFYLDVISYRQLSAHIASALSVVHESPQALLIHRGECIYDASHLDITVAEIQEALTLEAST
ncbi:MAG: bacillithiol system redox-active protein YtxJ [Lewinellaceae bacterium]|nr:bacillithiol system redox-active protein YtxJ [Saprospiraceae bacterium]MCB9342478.1 bacillithiol system redox-active protein YtxJ [Lewinellaceae bacterium]